MALGVLSIATRRSAKRGVTSLRAFQQVCCRPVRVGESRDRFRAELPAHRSPVPRPELSASPVAGMEEYA